LRDAGVATSLEIPVLSPKVQDLAATIELAAKTVGNAKRLRLYSPVRLWDGAGAPPRELMPPRWSDVAASVRAAVDRAESLGLSLSFAERDGIPLCGVLADGEVRAILPERDQRPMVRGSASRLGAKCSGCVASSMCPGVTDLYLATHGDDGLTPRKTPSRDFVQKKVRPDAVWTDHRRDSARQRYMAVLRPTVDCNQDCWFCSANETSQNVERDAARMSRRILRMARAGVKHLSFSGGEPTLSRHLIEHVAIARAAGIPVVELVTNAVLLDREEKVDAYAQAGVTNLFVSLHGHDETTSRAQTRKVGDHARTTRALKLFVERTSVYIRLNHVVTMRNYRMLVRFVEWVSEQFGTRISISFAYITPQYKALERMSDVVPAYREAAPFLKKALARAAELGIECVVGSRQGVPPCVLGDFAIFSDVAEISTNAQSEDAPQKTKAAACSTCRFDRLCTGVWKPYAEAYGTSELTPVVGAEIMAHEPLAEALSIRALPSSADIATGPEPRPRRSLDVIMDDAPPPLPIAIVGTGARALRIARAAAEAGLHVVGIASPHAPEKDLPEFGSDVARAISLGELLGARRARAVIVASSTSDHAASSRAGLAHGLPVLVEKPIAADANEAAALVAEAAGRLSVAHQMRMAPGFQELVREARTLTGRVELRVRHCAPDAMRTWSRGQLYESLIHLIDLAIAIHGTALTITHARGVGVASPESIELRGQAANGSFSIVSEPRAAEDLLEVQVSGTGRRIVWRRAGGSEELTTHDALGARTRTPLRGSDLSRLLAAWAESIRAGTAPPVLAVEGEAAMRLANDALKKLEGAGVPFDRANAPRHASSRELRERYD